MVEMKYRKENIKVKAINCAPAHADNISSHLNSHYPFKVFLNCLFGLN